MASLDMSELHRLTKDLGHASGQALPVVGAVLKKAAQNIKEELATDAKESKWFRRLGKSISYDSAYRIGHVGYDIGPDYDRGGELGAIAYFGGANGGGGTLDIDGPVRHEEPRMMAALDKALGDLL